MKKKLSIHFLTLLAWVGLSSMLQAQTGWVTGEALNDPRGHCAGTVCEGKIYVIGGAYSYSLASDKLEVYNPADRTWTVKAKLPFPLLNATAQTLNGMIYVAGGHDTIGSISRNSLLVYDPATNSWAFRAAMPSARGMAASAVVDGKLYVLGGETSISTLNKVEMYDPILDQWTEKAPLPTARAGFRAETIQGKIYAIGGIGDSGFMSAVDIYDPVANTWTTGPGMPGPRFWYGSAATDTVIYVFGGAINYQYTIETTLRFTPNTGWTDMNLKLPEFKVYGASALLGGSLYFIGGSLYPFYYSGMSGPKVTGSMFRCELTPVGTQEQTASAVAVLSVMPNPTASPASICYELKTGGRVDLRIFDPNGREVACLAKGIYPSGNYTMHWYAPGLPAGVYWCRLEVNEQATVKTIVLTR